MKKLLKFQMTEFDVTIVNECGIYSSTYISLIKKYVKY